MTTSKTPKPFHIGTLVKSAVPLDNAPELRVLFAWREYRNGPPQLCVAYTDALGGYAQWCPASALIHTDDGSPLGEWVPISKGMLSEVADRKGDAREPLSWRYWRAANAIIRGEVSQ